MVAMKRCIHKHLKRLDQTPLRLARLLLPGTHIGVEENKMAAMAWLHSAFLVLFLNLTAELVNTNAAFIWRMNTFYKT
jgi:hypothetical protein